MSNLKIALWTPVRVLVVLALRACIPAIDKSLDRNDGRMTDALLRVSNKLLRFLTRGSSWAYGTEIVEEE